MKFFTEKSLDKLRRKSSLLKMVQEELTDEPIEIGELVLGWKCPFCASETHSFLVERGTKEYACVKCGAYGDVIDFLMNYRKMSFVGAVEHLAKQFDVELEEMDPSRRPPLTKGQRRGRKRSLQEALRLMEEFKPGSVDEKLIKRVEEMEDE